MANANMQAMNSVVRAWESNGLCTDHCRKGYCQTCPLKCFPKRLFPNLPIEMFSAFSTDHGTKQMNG